MRVMFFDTESTDLSASWGRILCASFCDLDGAPFTFHEKQRKFKGVDPVDDLKLCLAIRDEIESADIAVSWNGIRHDIPLLDARLTLAGERPTNLGERYGSHHLDLMYYVPKVGGRSLDTVAKYYGLPVQKTPINGRVWQLAGAGDKSALKEIVKHCEHDVEVLRLAHDALSPFVKKIQFNYSEIVPFIREIPSRRR